MEMEQFGNSLRPAIFFEASVTTAENPFMLSSKLFTTRLNDSTLLSLNECVYVVVVKQPQGQWTYSVFKSIGSKGTTTDKNQFPPTYSSFSALNFPNFHFCRNTRFPNYHYSLSFVMFPPYHLCKEQNAAKLPIETWLDDGKFCQSMTAMPLYDIHQLSRFFDLNTFFSVQSCHIFFWLNLNNTWGNFFR